MILNKVMKFGMANGDLMRIFMPMGYYAKCILFGFNDSNEQYFTLGQAQSADVW